MRIEDFLGIGFYGLLLGITVWGTYQSRLPWSWLIRDLRNVALLIVLLICLSGIIGHLQSGIHAAVGSMLAMTLWVLVGFLWWSVSRWNAQDRKPP